MSSKVTITEQNELTEFVRTHLDHRLTALIAPIFDDANAYRNGRGDISKSAQEGSYVMLRLFIDFLGVTSDRKTDGKLNCNPGKDDDDLRLSAFSKWGTKNLCPEDFGTDQEFLAKVHRKLCKINAHFTYDVKEPKFRDRVAGLDPKEWKKAIQIVVNKLDERFYQKVGQDIVVHSDLQEQFKKQFSGVKSNVTSN